MFNLNFHFQNKANCNGSWVNRIICADGLSFSAQANGKGAYCSPQQDNVTWTHVEIGFPSEKVEEIMEFAEDQDDPTGTVYGYVPVEIVEAIVEAHGGLVNLAIRIEQEAKNEKAIVEAHGGLMEKNEKAAALKAKIETLQHKIKELKNELKMLS